jgi:adenylate kinase family enzyme
LKQYDDMRIAIFGNSGSGKSTLAQAFAATYGLRALDLDTVAWEPGQIAVPREHKTAVGDVSRFCKSHRSWVVEGCYGKLIEATLPHAPLLLFIEPGLEACLANCRSRPWEPHKYVSKHEQDVKLDFLLAWVSQYYTRQDDLSLAAHQALFEAYRGPKHKLTTRVEASRIGELAQLAEECTQ